MRTAVVVTVVIVVGVFAWSIANRLSADAIGMALGLGFGVLASIPAALLVLVASRRRAPWEEEEEETARPPVGYLPYGNQSPVVVVTAGMPQAAANNAGYAPQDGYGYAANEYPPRPALPGPTHHISQPRVFRMIGEAEEVLHD